MIGKIGNLERPDADSRHRSIWRATSRTNAACGSIKEKLKGEKIVTTSARGQPAGHEPGKSIEKFDRNFHLGDASNLGKKNGESQNSHSASPSSHHTANTHTHLRSPEKLVRTYVYVEVASNRN